jgi:hypothetical protein
MGSFSNAKAAVIVLALVGETQTMSNISLARLRPTEADLIDIIAEYYQGNARFERCMHVLNYPRKPLSIPVLYHVTLTAMAYAEEIITECK